MRKNSYLRKILNDNNIKRFEIYNLIGCSRIVLESKLSLIVDFKIEELEKIKEYLVLKGVIPDNFDIGCFLDII